MISFGRLTMTKEYLSSMDEQSFKEFALGKIDTTMDEALKIAKPFLKKSTPKKSTKKKKYDLEDQ